MMSFPTIRTEPDTGRYLPCLSVEPSTAYRICAPNPHLLISVLPLADAPNVSTVLPISLKENTIALISAMFLSEALTNHSSSLSLKCFSSCIRVDMTLVDSGQQLSFGVAKIRIEPPWTLDECPTCATR